MAQKKTQTKQPTKKKSSSAKKPVYQGRSGYSRLTLSLFYLILGILAFLAWLNADGLVIHGMRALMTGLLGGGAVLLAPALLLAGILYAVSRERPHRSRIVALLCLAPLLGGFMQVLGGEALPLELESVPLLWADGQSLLGGGALSGSLATLLVFLISRPGTLVLLSVLTVFAAVAACGLTWVGIVGGLRRWMDETHMNRLKAEEERIRREEEESAARQARAEQIAADKKRLQETQRTRRTAIDIPMDTVEPEQPPEKPKREKKKKEALFDPGLDVPPPEPLSQPIAPAEPEPLPLPEELPPEPPLLTEVENPFLPPLEKAEKPAPANKKEKPKAPEGQIEKSFADLIEENAKRDLAESLQVYQFPPLELLEEPKAAGRDTASELTATKERLELILRSFGINSTISNIVNGPSVTRYEMELEIGIKLNKLTGLSDDIALALGVGGVRIAAIPNKVSTVGIEVPNKNTTTVWLRELVSSKEFNRASSRLTFCLGKNIGGEVMLGNINKLPHLLVAGTTGSGKSVCLNSLILSLMYKATPEEVKFIMIDPKMVEFKIYNGIPHLLVPVVTEAKKAAGALQWAVTEMMKRYRLFSEAGARDIAGYNQICREEGEKPLPFIVVIIDELADLMLVAAKEVEESICRVAQMGRAAGVHLVIATQSPRADVITGLMKANIPSRIAFKVASSLESRIILDAGGAADKLMGNGDMLYAPIGTSKPIRIQGSWVSDGEREKIVEFVKKQSGEATYAEDVIYEIERAAEDKGSGKREPAPEEPLAADFDELIPQAVEVIFETKQASVSMLQRRLKLGYARAARLVDQMEEIGVVGPFEGSKPRQILLTREQWQEMQFVNGTAPIGPRVEQLSLNEPPEEPVEPPEEE